jgi:hypothetical protein
MGQLGLASLVQRRRSVPGKPRYNHPADGIHLDRKLPQFSEALHRERIIKDFLQQRWKSLVPTIVDVIGVMMVKTPANHATGLSLR